jgi:predicted N-acyltransferase
MLIASMPASPPRLTNHPRGIMLAPVRSLSLHNTLPRPKIDSAAGQARVVDSIRAIGADAWNACFPGELEDYHYLLAVERAGIAGFEWRYAIVEENGQVVAAMPAFLTDYHLETTLDDGGFRRTVRSLRRRFPRFFAVKLACLGSPETECGLAGFHPGIPEARKAELLAHLLSCFEGHALSQGCTLIGIKDVPAQHKALWNAAAPGYSAIPGMATARLSIDFKTVDEYLARLSKRSRKDMRRKLKSREDIRVEQRTEIDDVLPQVLDLYLDTKRRSEFQFEELTAAYFSGVLEHMKGRAFCTLYFHDTTLLAANLMLKDENTLLDKFFCMNGEKGRSHNLYFLSWFYNLECCLKYGIAHYQSGQACYGNKLRLKSVLHPNWMLFRHRNPVVNRMLALVAPVLSAKEQTHDL